MLRRVVWLLVGEFFVAYGVFFFCGHYGLLPCTRWLGKPMQMVVTLSALVCPILCLAVQGRFSWLSWGMSDFFHWFGHPHLANQDLGVVFSSLFRATRFTVEFEPEPVWGSIALPCLRWTVEWTCTVLSPEASPFWVSKLSALVVLCNVVVMVPTESPRLFHLWHRPYFFHTRTLFD